MGCPKSTEEQLQVFQEKPPSLLKYKNKIKFLSQTHFSLLPKMFKRYYISGVGSLL